MLRSRLLVAILLLTAFLFSCSGEDGATGPTGPKGTDGTDGNANVVMYEFGTQTTTTGMLLYQFEATQGFADSCMYFGYYKTSVGSNTWYPIPGIGPDAAYESRSYIQQSNATAQRYYVKLVNMAGLDYTASTTFAVMKLYIVPPSVIIPITSRGLLNVSDYNAVRDYLNLSE